MLLAERVDKARAGCRKRGTPACTVFSFTGPSISDVTTARSHGFGPNSMHPLFVALPHLYRRRGLETGENKAKVGTWRSVSEKKRVRRTRIPGWAKPDELQLWVGRLK